MDSDLYIVEASLPAPSDHSQVMQMLRRLLAESFHLKTHSETRQTRVYQLIVDKGGSKLQPLPEGESPRRPSNLPADTMAVSPGATLPELVRYLNTQAATPIGWPVVDHTGIQGRFDLWFTFETKFDPTGRSGTFDVDYFTQLPDKLGLRLVSGREDYSYLVVDGADKPLAP